jgi:anti-sigma regulatory factor (Ser/Thr protein kinase)
LRVAPPGFDPALDATIESSPRAPGVARRAVTELAKHIEPGTLRDVQLLITEIVTNSIRHSGCEDPIRLRVWSRPSGVKVEIADGGFGFEPSASNADVEAEGGRGLLILQTLADRWGVSRDTRARVWFELSARPVSRRAQAG